MKHQILSSIFLSFAFISAPAFAGESCPDNFASGAAPVLTNQNMAAKTQMLCYKGFAVMHSGISRTPLWSAEYLTPDRLAAAKGMKRKNPFHAEDRLPRSDRAELNDYRGSCFDRGHQSPNGDAWDEESQFDTFTLANMVPQNPAHNEELWEGIERRTKEQVTKYGPAYVITGPIFAGATIERLNGRVMVPTHLYKAIYMPARGEAAAYISPNSSTFSYEVVSIAELERRVGINLFPQMPPQMKAAAMPLPGPAKAKFHAREPLPGCEAAGAGQTGTPEESHAPVHKSMTKTLIKELKHLMK